ncbi:hypothetical protein Mag101_15335 [Microbulbifer agarilyticus]|uniref:Uncharacterized protein n=1 Tax=Microbulbifer agarilyticus TaxID=260552 RepID=A0A1Q2M852_9GAMM|nr:hypothetical protein [Microbulbifer agarilyticus]AQQ68851.1 hypothetical protein Mag101_15335 [Microbulbifer agarilyticus]
MTEAVGLGKHAGTKLDDDLWLDDHLFEIREKIVVRAKELLADANNQLTKAAALSEAAKEYAPGMRFPDAQQSSWRENILNQLSAVTLISALLAIVFGGIAFGISLAAEEGEPVPDVAGYIDLVKIFAGAVVGSTGAAVVANHTKHRGHR